MYLLHKALSHGSTPARPRLQSVIVASDDLGSPILQPALCNRNPLVDGFVRRHKDQSSTGPAAQMTQAADMDPKLQSPVFDY